MIPVRLLDAMAVAIEHGHQYAVIILPGDQWHLVYVGRATVH